MKGISSDALGSSPFHHQVPRESASLHQDRPGILPRKRKCALFIGYFNKIQLVILLLLLVSHVAAFPNYFQILQFQ